MGCRVDGSMLICAPMTHRAGGKTPVPPGRWGSRMQRGLMLHVVKNFWARADV